MSQYTAPTILSAKVEYGDATVDIEPTLFVLDNKRIWVETFVDAPEYSTPGRERVMVVGRPVKKDGSPANRQVKPVVSIEILPSNVREALVSARNAS